MDSMASSTITIVSWFTGSPSIGLCQYTTSVFFFPGLQVRTVVHSNRSKPGGLHHSRPWNHMVLSVLLVRLRTESSSRSLIPLLYGRWPLPRANISLCPLADLRKAQRKNCTIWVRQPCRVTVQHCVYHLPLHQLTTVPFLPSRRGGSPFSQ
jgi:hypothetical protein